MTVTIYSTPHCVSCKAAAQYLARMSLPFEYVDMTQDEATFEEASKWGRKSPIITNGYQAVIGFSEDKIEQVLALYKEQE